MQIMRTRFRWAAILAVGISIAAWSETLPHQSWVLGFYIALGAALVVWAEIVSRRR